MGGQMKGGEMNGSEARVVFITMDGCILGDEKKSHVCCGMVHWLLIGGGTVIAMAMGVSTSMSDHQNYVRPLVISPLISNLHILNLTCHCI
jgi:hypothetical protein